MKLLGNLVDDKKFADVIFNLPGKAQVYAHLAILKLRCPNVLKKGVKNLKAKKDGTTVDVVDPVLGRALKNVLGFAYTGSVRLTNRTLEELLGISSAARLYEMPRLLFLVEQELSSRLTMESVFEMLKWSHELKDDFAWALALDLVRQNYTTFVASPQALQTLSMPVFQDIVARASQNNYPALNFTPETSSEITKDLKELFSKMDGADLTIQCVGGVVQCHSYMLAAVSPQLDAVVTEAVKGKTRTLGIEFPVPALKAVLKYVYYGEKRIDPLEATQVVLFAKRFGLPKLVEICESAMTTNIDDSTVLEILKVAFSGTKGGKENEMKGQALQYAAQNIANLDLALFKPPNKAPPGLVFSLLAACKDQMQKGGFSSAPSTPASTHRPPPPTRTTSSSGRGQRAPSSDHEPAPHPDPPAPSPGVGRAKKPPPPTPAPGASASGPAPGRPAAPPPAVPSKRAKAPPPPPPDEDGAPPSMDAPPSLSGPPKGFGIPPNLLALKLKSPPGALNK